MKYLNNREDFLKRSIKKIDEYKKYESVVSINEGVENSGPFANDIPWGDSLLGRLINSTIRKAKIGANLVRIKGVVRRLKDAFDDIIGMYTTNQLSDEDKKEFVRFRVYTFLDNLQRAVENEENVGEIKNLTKAAITDIESFEDFDGKNELLDQLKKFSKFLEQFKDDEGGEPTGSEEDKEDKEDKKGEGEEGEGEEGEGEGASGDKKSSESLYPVMVKNLKALGLVLSNYKNVKIISKSPTNVASSETINKYKTQPGDTVDKIVANTEVNKKKFTAEVLRQKNQKVLEPFPKNNQTLKPGLILIMESFRIFEAVPGTNNQPGGSQDRGNIKGGEDHLTQAFTKLKKDIEVLISSKEKGIGVDTNFIKEITSKAVDSNTKNQIKALYVEINRYLVGDKKATIQEKDPLYKESLEIITDKNKRVVVAEKMARFTKRALQFDKENLYGGLGDLTKPLKDYVDSIKQIMQMSPVEPKKEEPKKEEPKKEETKKEEVKKESHLFKYNSFITMLKEADEEVDKKDDKEEGVGAPDVMTTSQKIKDYWQKNIDIKEYVIEKTEAIKMKEKFDKLEKEQAESIQIQGIDPVLDVVKCFNRAYKIHTTQVIPSGRSGGAVSNSVFMEYTCFGTGDPSSAGKSGGPYRNNAIFNQWEDAVLNIMRDKTYQKIFNVGTTLKVGNEVIEKAGSNLRKFMSDMLDGEELYKSGDSRGEAGQQAKFLDKYFNYKVEDPKDTNFGGREEQEEVTGIGNSMPEATPVKFSKEACKYQKAEELKGTFFAISTKGDGKMYYFYIQDVKGDIAYIVYCRVFTFFKKYLESSSIKLEEVGDLPKKCNSIDRLTDKGSEKVEYILKATTKKVEDIVGTDGKFKLSGSTYEITHLTRYEGKKNNANVKAALADKPDTLEIDRCYTLIEMKKDVNLAGEKTRFTLTKSIGPAIAQYGGFKDITTTNDISKAKITRL